jgi:serine/threonine protein kinase
LDLGLAAFHESSSKNEGTGSGSNDTSSILGTADFLAPEQAVADAPVDIRSDIYSLGVTLYFLLAGKAPFEDLTLAQKLVGHQFKLPPAPVAPQPLLRVLGRMMAKRPELRYQTPSEVVSALFPFADHQLVPPRVDEMPTLSKAASGPLTSRGRGATIVSMVGLAGLGKPTPLPTGLNNSPPSGLHSGPRPARPLSELSGDTPTPGSAPTLMFPPSGSKVPEDFPFDPVKFLSGEDVPVSTDHPTTS